MADDTIKAKYLLAGLDRLHATLNRVFIMYTADRNIALGPLDDRSFSSAGCSYLATDKEDRGRASQWNKDLVGSHRVSP